MIVVGILGFIMNGCTLFFEFKPKYKDVMKEKMLEAQRLNDKMKDCEESLILEQI